MNCKQMKFEMEIQFIQDGHNLSIEEMKQIQYSQVIQLFQIKYSLMHDSESTSPSMRIDYNSQSIKHRLNLPITQFNRSKTALSDCPTQVVSSRQTSTQRSSRYCCSLWEKNWSQTQKRRQNQLQSMFRIRKEKLEQITKQNKNLYVRLNTKVSQYSARQHREKVKQSHESQCLTFRTVGLKESRQILGPIINFRPSTELKIYNQQQNFIIDNQNSCQLRQNIALKSKQNIVLKQRQKRVEVLKMSISKKLNLYQNQQKTQRNDIFKSRNITTLKKSNKQNLYRKSQFRQGLPEIYTFF